MDAKKDGTKIFDIGEEKYKVGKKKSIIDFALFCAQCQSQNIVCGGCDTHRKVNNSFENVLMEKKNEVLTQAL